MTDKRSADDWNAMMVQAWRTHDEKAPAGSHPDILKEHVRLLFPLHAALRDWLAFMRTLDASGRERLAAAVQGARMEDGNLPTDFDWLRDTLLEFIDAEDWPLRAGSDAANMRKKA